MSSYEAGIRERAYNKGYETGLKDGYKNAWNDICLAIENPGGYTLLYNAVHGTSDYPEGFAVVVNSGERIRS